MSRIHTQNIAGYLDTDGNAYCVDCFRGYSTEAEIDAARRLDWNDIEQVICTLCGERLDGRHLK